MRDSKSLFDQLSILVTEHRNKQSVNIDSLSSAEVLSLINNEDKKVPRAVTKEIRYIARAVDMVVDAFKNGGRLIYIGAGTSGRLGILDASECPPTYGTDPELVQGIIAGGRRSVFRSQEGAEDKCANGVRDIRAKRVSSKDVVCGISASVHTPFVVASIQEAKRLGAKTIYVTTNPRSVLKQREFAELYRAIDVAICPTVGPEVIMGSTRMKAGTAQKLVLNMITTTAMIRLGKVYKNMMVDLMMNSRKLRERAKRVLMIATGVDYDTATEVLASADGHVKTAIVMIRANISASEARRRLKNADGFVRKALDDQHSRRKR